jgi:isoleucyl-tRNA synthetase
MRATDRHTEEELLEVGNQQEELWNENHARKEQNKNTEELSKYRMSQLPPYAGGAPYAGRAP